MDINHKIIKIKSGGDHHGALSIEGYLYMWGKG